MDDFWFQLLVPQEFEAFEVCRVIWTWYIGLSLLPRYFRVADSVGSFESPTRIITGFLVAMVFAAVFLVLVGRALYKIQNLLPLVHNPFIASIIIFLFAALPISLITKAIWDN